MSTSCAPLKPLFRFGTTFVLLFSLQVTGLAKGAAYHVRVSAYNGVALSYGKTEPSTLPVVNPGGAPEPPSRVEVEAFSPSSLAISWSPPNDAMGGDVTAYQVVSQRERERERHSVRF